uniref:(northern house mosquito) hypothetical protein n=1 Tax=Culex pipiens TaxID=7175 RepID=A0A8D8DPU8_CULPI
MTTAAAVEESPEIDGLRNRWNRRSAASFHPCSSSPLLHLQSSQPFPPSSRLLSLPQRLRMLSTIPRNSVQRPSCWLLPVDFRSRPPLRPSSAAQPSQWPPPEPSPRPSVATVASLP